MSNMSSDYENYRFLVALLTKFSNKQKRGWI